MVPVLWMVMSGICAIGMGGLVFFIMQSHNEVLLSKQREELAAANATLAAQKEAMEGALRNMEATTRRQAMDEFLAEIRVEERHYVREHKVLFVTRKCMVRQERIFFRNIPLSNWVEQEMPFEEGADMDKLVDALTIFAPEGLFGDADHPVRRMLR